MGTLCACFLGLWVGLCAWWRRECKFGEERWKRSSHACSCFEFAFLCYLGRCIPRILLLSNSHCCVAHRFNWMSLKFHRNVLVARVMVRKSCTQLLRAHLVSVTHPKASLAEPTYKILDALRTVLRTNCACSAHSTMTFTHFKTSDFNHFCRMQIESFPPTHLQQLAECCGATC